MSMPEHDVTTFVQEDKVFVDGAKHGHILYRQLHQARALHLTPQQMYHLVMNTLIDTSHESLWNTGYLAGWFVALSQDPTHPLVKVLTDKWQEGQR